ncbi:TlpA family protein disulfide reductase [Arthrobacter rhombi]|uniref:TlpA family protein disulfide reductase n=1 Tax=Micrococcaceae TaxID=1268 RepID=UPI000BB83EBA|nr:TlpA disulfide reductase family protein [Glutamicibacter sp. BW78]PCC24642.1 thiol-disulfide isomerase [Glutamicibacter sp. BW78]
MPVKYFARRPAIIGAVLASLLLSGCAAVDEPLVDEANSQNSNYVAGDGSITEYEPATRGEKVKLSGELFDGTTVTEKAWSGQVAVLNVWYAACSPCRVEAPDLASLYNEFKSKDVEFYGINTRDEAPTAKAFARTFELDYPSFKDKSSKIVLALAGYVPPQAVPTTLVLDKEGRVAGRILGVADKSTLKSMIKDALRGSGPVKP